jgi:hypothetical protein
MSQRSQNRTKRSSLNEGDACSTRQARTGNRYRNIRRRTIGRVRDVRHHWKSYSASQECRSRAGASAAEATIPALAVCDYSPWASSTQRLRQPGTPRIWQKWHIWQRRRQHNHYPRPNPLSQPLLLTMKVSPSIYRSCPRRPKRTRPHTTKGLPSTLTSIAVTTHQHCLPGATLITLSALHEVFAIKFTKARNRDSISAAEVAG